MLNRIKSVITTKNFGTIIIWFIATIVVIQLTIFINEYHENKGRAELLINNVDYDIKWLAVRESNASELINEDRYEIFVRTNVTNRKDSVYSAEITKAEYHILKPNNQIRSRWTSGQESISIYPGTTFTKVDRFDEIHLEPGNYTLKTRIEFEDKKGIITPLMFSAKITLPQRQSPQIVDNRDW